MAQSKPREIVVKAKQVVADKSPSMALHARDSQTGASLTVPMPVWRNGNTVTGREAAEHLASLLLLAQGRGGLRPVWDRGTPDRDTFLVFDA